MNKRLGCSLLVLLFGGVVAAQPLKIAVIQELGEFAPSVAAVFESAGVPAEAIPESSARMLAEIKSGALDGAFLFSETALASIPEMRKVPVVLYQNEYIAVTARPDLKIKALADLAKLRVGYVRGNQTFEQLLKQVPTAQGQDLTDTPQVYKMLGGGRVDVILSTTSALLIFGSLAEVPLYAQEPALLTIPLYLVLSNKRAAEFSKVTAAFEKVVKSGEWARTVRTSFEAIRLRSSKP